VKRVRKSSYLIDKRLIDILGSVIGLIVFVIPALIISVAIKLEDGGPILYGQQRVGKNGKPFKIWKFRSMVPNAHQKKKQLIQSNEIDGAMFKMKDDPRITRIGKFIRQHSLDEIPQFYNVLIGQMSLVGPRPALPEEVKQYDARSLGRISVTPGITGLWQVSGRNNLTFDQMVDLDLQYVTERSLMMDIHILMKTVLQMFNVQSNGAY